MSPSTSSSRQRQHGGGAIVLVLILLVVMSLMAFGVSRSAFRELAISGTLSQGLKAADAAEAGLDWFITWSLPDNATLATSTTGNKQLISSMKFLTQSGWAQTDTTNFGAWDMAFRLDSNEADVATNDMVFDKDAAIVKQGAKNQVMQKFSLVVRSLGKQDVTLTSVNNNASGGTETSGSGAKDNLFQVISEGYAAIPTGSGAYRRFMHRRELIGLQSPAQGQ